MFDPLETFPTDLDGVIPGQHLDGLRHPIAEPFAIDLAEVNFHSPFARLPVSGGLVPLCAEQGGFAPFAFAMYSP